ncbi:MAG TPA: hypothetical protein VGQ46_05945 [Thermoanaerobaculia bacterium]|nr:hypothetical protein [Thermoanaerobaculia bacterium]
MAIAHNASETLIVWTAGGNVVAERLSPSGVALNTISVTSGDEFADAAVAGDGSRYFVVWSTGKQLLGSFITDGSPTPPRALFSQPFSGPQGPEELTIAPDVAWDGQQFIVVFGERPNLICGFLCPIPPPDRFRVMRVSAAGDAIDTSPAVIAGSHLNAHVASSGAESLIALDSVGEVSTMVAHTQSGLTLDAEIPLFHWFSDVSSGVAWDGSMYTVGWRYAGADASWLGAAHVTRAGLPLDYRVALPSGPMNLPFVPSKADFGQMNLPFCHLSMTLRQMNLPLCHLNMTLGQMNLPLCHLSLTLGQMNLPLCHLKMTLGQMNPPVCHLEMTLGQMNPDASGGQLFFGSTTSWARPSIAVNQSGVTAFAISEATGPSALVRARLYLASELAPMPDPPAAPRNVVSYFGGNTARIDWQSNDTPTGFAIEGSTDSGQHWFVQNVVSSSARTTTVFASVGNLFRVRAFGPGGVSEGTITSIGSMQRRRAQRP